MDADLILIVFNLYHFLFCLNCLYYHNNHISFYIMLILVLMLNDILCRNLGIGRLSCIYNRKNLYYSYLGKYYIMKGFFHDLCSNSNAFNFSNICSYVVFLTIAWYNHFLGINSKMIYFYFSNQTYY